MESTSEAGAGSQRPRTGRVAVSITLGGRPVSDAVRASLAAVRAAQEAARLRQRRDTLRMRALAATALLTFVAGILVFDHFQGGRRAAAGIKRPAARIPMSMAPPRGPAVEMSISDPAPASMASPADDALDICGDAVTRGRLRTAAGACAEAFAARPADSTLAMRVAKVQHARGQYRDAGEWAGRAIALHTTDADAFVILAHAETRARHPVAARAAYRQYLTLAPRGWHASEARRALRAAPRQERLRAEQTESR